MDAEGPLSPQMAIRGDWDQRMCWRFHLALAYTGLPSPPLLHRSCLLLVLQRALPRAGCNANVFGINGIVLGICYRLGIVGL